MIKSSIYNISEKTNSVWDSSGEVSEPFHLIEGKDFIERNTPNNLGKGDTYSDPHYLTTTTKRTAPEDDPNNTAQWIRQQYAKRQIWNSDKSLYICQTSDGYFGLYEDSTDNMLTRLEGVTGDAEYFWHHSNPNRFGYRPNGYSLAWKVYDIDVGVFQNNLDLTKVTSVNGDDDKTSILDIFPDAFATTMRQEGRPSSDDRYLAVSINNSSGNLLGFCCLDISKNKITGTLSAEDWGGDIDWITASHFNKRIVIQGASYKKTTSYDITFKNPVDIAYGSHADIVVMPDGREMYVGCNFESDTSLVQDGYIFYADIETGVHIKTSINLYDRSTGHWNGYHVSGLAINKPGWAFISTFNTGGTDTWFSDKLLAVELGGKERILNIGNTWKGDNGYWHEPHGTVNDDFTQVAWASSWGKSGDSNLCMYTIELPEGTVPNWNDDDDIEPPNGDKLTISSISPEDHKERTLVTVRGSGFNKLESVSLSQGNSNVFVDFNVTSDSQLEYTAPYVRDTRLNYSLYKLRLVDEEGGLALSESLSVTPAEGTILEPLSIHPIAEERIQSNPDPVVEDQFVWEDDKVTLRRNLTFYLNGSISEGDYSFMVWQYRQGERRWSNEVQYVNLGLN